MDNRYFDTVINEMKPFLDENGFKEQDGAFVSDTKAAKVSYNDERQMYQLYMAEVENGTVGEYSEVSAWLFDDSQTQKDAESVAIDFTATLRDKMGIKIKRSVNSQIDLPTAKAGTYDISAFSKKVLDIYPQFKENYKAHIAFYGNFLYLNFFGETLVPQMRSVLCENNKKAVKKLCEMLENGYVQGDRDTVNAIVAVCAAAVLNDDTAKTNLFSALADNSHFVKAVEQFIPVLSGNKKLQATLIK